MKQEALEYHEEGRPGKIEVMPTKPYCTARDLSLAYSPGVAYPCLEIEKNPDDAYRYTNRGNLVAVISNGTAVLGLGNIGALAGKPVMEGKALLFKIYAGLDSFDIEINESDPQKMWAMSFFGKPLSDMVREGLNGKLMRMPADAQEKVQETLTRIINDGDGGMICILL